ncbi:glycerol-3-phosphate 1-O-acyltransferase PlsY [Chloroflexota bacterium]
MIIVKFIAVVLVGYLLGSIPAGHLIGRRSVNIDITKVGSGKTGATNVLRTAGKKAGLAVAIADVGKGALAVFFAGLIFRGENMALVNSGLLEVATTAQILGALAAIIGHSWSVFLRFQGGRGVATFFGGLFVLYYPAALFGGLLLIIGAGLTKYMSLGSITGSIGTFAILVPLTIFKVTPLEYLIYSLIGAIFIIVMHRGNISRLLAGNERKIGEKTETER